MTIALSQICQNKHTQERNTTLDRTLLYTAVTRAQTQVILVGDVAAAKAAVEAPPHASLRQVALGSMLNEILKGMA